MKQRIYQIDAFTDTLFKGNYAAVCPLKEWLPEKTMQNIAAENNLPETAFFTGSEGKYRIRWFTPENEIDLCGHATLASSFLIDTVLKDTSAVYEFSSMSGPLTVTRDSGVYYLDFPSRTGRLLPIPEGLEKALGVPVKFFLQSRDFMAVLDSEHNIKNLDPDLDLLEKIGIGTLIVTASGTSADFVSRFFAPGFGIPEDPATGSSHCTLIPYWAAELGKTVMTAEQVSERGGSFYCEDRGERVKIGGRAVMYLEGSLCL